MSSQTLLLLSGVGGVLLWGTMFMNDTLDGLSLAVQHGEFPGGRPIRKVFTSYPSVDNSLVVVVGFFDLLAAKQNSAAPTWLFFDLCNVLGAINTWVLIESRRRGVRNFFLRHIIIFIFLWNMAGAAMVMPIYFYLLTKSEHTVRDHTIPLNEARGLPPTLIANALFPLLIFAPRWRGCSAHTHQGLIALYHLTPAIMIVVVVACSRPGTTLTQIATPKKKAAPNEDAPWIVASLIATGVLSAAVHLYVVLAAISASWEGRSDLSMSRLLLPAPQESFNMPQGSLAALVEGAHLFTQLDWLVLAAASVVFTNDLLKKSSEGQAGNKKHQQVELWWNIVGTAVLGPAAAGSFVLAAREVRLRTAPPALAVK